MKTGDIREKSFLKLKARYPFRVVLKRIKGKYYYVYKEHGEYDRASKKTRTVSEYLGRIMPNGSFVEKSPYTKGDLERAAELVEKSGGRITWPEQKTNNSAQEEAIAGRIGDTDRAILEDLADGGDTPALARRLQISDSALYRRIDKLERRYAIRYTIEASTDKLGYYTYILFIKFEGEPPDAETLKAVFEAQPETRIAMTTMGAYDLVAFFFACNNYLADLFVYKLKNETALKGVKARWAVSHSGINCGFLPLRDGFFDMFERERVWRRTKESPRRDRSKFTPREAMVLRELSGDAGRSFAEIAHAHGLTEQSVRYVYEKLKREGVILRITTSLKAPMKYCGILLIETHDERGEWGRIGRFILEDGDHIVNKVAFESHTSIPYGQLLFLPVFEEGGLDDAATALERSTSNGDISELIVTEMLVGEVCYRKLGRDKLSQYDLVRTMNADSIPALYEPYKE